MKKQVHILVFSAVITVILILASLPCLASAQELTEQSRATPPITQYRVLDVKQKSTGELVVVVKTMGYSRINNISVNYRPSNLYFSMPITNGNLVVGFFDYFRTGWYKDDFPTREIFINGTATCAVTGRVWQISRMFTYDENPGPAPQ